MATKKQNFERPDGREQDQLRKVKIVKDIAPAAKGSVLLSMGSTQVICAATVDNMVPRWMKAQKIAGGWVTAEYSLLSYSTQDRTRREVVAGKPSGRTQEIQRLIGRSLRAAIDLEALGQRTIWIDCDVLQADGGTRTASVTGGFIAMRLAINALLQEGTLKEDPVREAVAAVSVGMYKGKAVLDLNYEEDFAADVDMNIVMTSSGKFIELQGTAEEAPYTQSALNTMLRLGRKGITELLAHQEKAIAKQGK